MEPPDEQVPPKKPYQTPELRLYGDLGSLTEGMKGGPVDDGQVYFGFVPLMS